MCLCVCLLRILQQEAEKEQQSRELLEKRIQAVTSLKSNIAATQVNGAILPFWQCIMVVVFSQQRLTKAVEQYIINTAAWALSLGNIRPFLLSHGFCVE